MKYRLIYTVFFISILLIINACTTKANTYYNRQMQPIVTKYNVLFNGEEAFESGLKQLHEQYQDDFSQLLPVEPIRMTGKVQLEGVENPNFERAEEKAIKTIQLHSMVFKGEQRNYKIDDAYILLGKARYHNERFLPALEAFNHLLTNYGKSERINESAIWAQKTNMRLGKDKIAIEKLNELLSKEKLRKRDRAEAYATLGQAYINQKMYPEAAESLYLAGKYTSSKTLRGRYYFIAAQLYEHQKQRDSATIAFEKVVKLNWKIPRKLWVEAQAGKARNRDFTPEEKTEFLTYLTKLENRYEHKDYLDVLYFTHAFLIEENSRRMAIEYYRRSLKNNKENNPLKAKTHERLADIFFEQKDYTGAYHHLDSTLAYIPEHTFEHLYVERKKENLAKITELEYTVKQNDSILKIIKMSDSDRVAFFQKHIDSLKKKTEQKMKSSSTVNQGMGFSLQNATETKGGKFYFYNPMAVAYGKQQFQQYWGNRKLEDNWRWSAKQQTEIETNPATTGREENVPKKDITPDFYLSQLPKNEKEIKRLERDRNQALLQLGILYKAKFNDSELAIDRLERVLGFNPEPIVESAVLYELYKNYRYLNSPKAETVKNHLLGRYPQSDYAQLLQGNDTSRKQRDLEAQQFLQELTVEFNNGKIVEVLQRLNEEGTTFKETAMASKLDMLRANVVARLEGILPYREELLKIQMNYPETDESNQAKELLENLIDVEKESFVDDAKASSWKVVLMDIPQGRREVIKTQLVEKLKVISDKISISQDVYNVKETWFVIHGLQNRDSADSVIIELQKIISENQLATFPISTENYRLVQIKKAKESYLNR
ncbi:tetratricopeptide repeat protein [Capnocytophaga canis]|uniref:type IX secretion system periplasmic lipoprotein PorW/SprE n=1 Tax=Capnocytophaga canis TaxID=1848903 RepID=UPI0015623951|nr:hypothetical protein [Capnocytophaga canis]